MSQEAIPRSNNSFDPAMIAAIARKVVERLQSAQVSANTIHCDDHVISANTIEELSGNPDRLVVNKLSVVTPSARDEAKRRGITIERNVKQANTTSHHHAHLQIIDANQPDRAASVRDQVLRRNIVGGPTNIRLSDTPARDVYELCGQHGEVAVMIGSALDVPRFACELSPTVWVLDMKRLNLAGAVHVTTQIIHLTGAPA